MKIMTEDLIELLIQSENYLAGHMDSCEVSFFQTSRCNCGFDEFVEKKNKAIDLYYEKLMNEDEEQRQGGLQDL